MERLQLKAATRGKTSKGKLKELRREGFIPGVVYGSDISSTSLVVNGKELSRALSTSAGANVLIDLFLKSGTEEKKTVMIKEVQRNPIKGTLLHVDFIKISLEDKLQVKVPINFQGEPRGIKEGGVASMPLREVMVESLPTVIPEQLDIDITDLGVGESLTIADLEVPPGVEIMEDPDETLVSIVAPTLVEEPVEAEGEAAETGDEETPAGEGVPVDEEA